MLWPLGVIGAGKYLHPQSVLDTAYRAVWLRAGHQKVLVVIK